LENASDKPTHKRVYIAVGAVSLILVLMMVMSHGKGLARVGIDAVLGSFAGRASPPQFSETDWRTRTFEGLGLEAPFEFRPVDSIAKNLPPEVKATMDSFEMYEGNAGAGFRVSVTKACFNSSVEVNIDGAMHGAVTKAAAKLGDSDPEYSSEALVVSGMEARRASYRSVRSSYIIHIDSVVVRDGNSLWGVQVLYLYAACSADAARILGSIDLNQWQLKSIDQYPAMDTSPKPWLLFAIR